MKSTAQARRPLRITFLTVVLVAPPGQEPAGSA